MSRERRTGVTVEARVAELERNLELMGDELERLETEHARYRDALRRIERAESGAWGWIAREALHPGAIAGRAAAP